MQTSHLESRKTIFFFKKTKILQKDKLFPKDNIANSRHLLS